MIQKPSKTPANRPGTPAVVPETTIVLRETVTVPGATTTVFGHTTNVSSATPTVPAAMLAIVARNAWYTARMQWIRNAHRHTKTRWMLTVLTLLTLATWIVTRWGGVTWTFGNGGGIALYHGVVAGGFGSASAPPQVSGVRWAWNPDDAAWLHVVSYGYWGDRDFATQFTLLAPAIIMASLAGWLWYRRWRPANRPDRPARTRTMNVMRWTFAATSILLVGAATPTYWYRATFRGSSIDAAATRGMLMASSSGFLTVRGGFPMGLSFESLPPRPARSPLHEVNVTLLHVSSMTGGKFIALVSFWPLAALSAAFATMLWCVRRNPAAVHACPHCQYDLTGLAAETPCPECGHTPKAPRSAVT